MSSEKRGLKLHSIIEKLSEQCERNSPSHDEECEDTTCTLETAGVKRKQRKRNEVKRVCIEALSSSDSEDELSDVDIELLDGKAEDNSRLLEASGAQHELSTEGHIWSGRRASARLREARRNTWRKQSRKQPSTESISPKKKKKSMKVRVNISKVVDENNFTGVDKDLAINVDAFVHHLPLVEDIEPAGSSPCPFCSVLCEEKHDLVKHIKDQHQSECAIVDSEEGDKASDIEAHDIESDEEFQPYKVTRTKRKNAKDKHSRKKKTTAGASSRSDSELYIDVQDLMNISPGVDDIDKTAEEWSCPSCSVKLCTEQEFTTHIGTCNKTDITTGISKDTLKARCPCQACGVRFCEWKELRDHFSENPECQKRYKCDECGLLCMTSSSLKKHKNLHSDERPFKCDECNASFKDKSYLARHAFTHTGVKNFKCEVCHKLFSHKRTLREHKMVHTGERPHKCAHCDASFTNSSSLKTHTARHTGIFPFKCQVCARQFAKSYGLKMHSLSHSNEKPFVCEVCGKGFKRGDHLREHRIIHSDNKPYKCDTCQKTFSQRVCLRKHLPCREHEKQQRKANNILAKQSAAKNKRRGSGSSTSNALKTIAFESDGAKGQVIDEYYAAKLADSCSIPNDITATSSPEDCSNERSLLDERGESPPSFIRQPPKLIETEYYSGHHDYPHDREFSSGHLPERSRTSPISSLLPSAFIPSLPHAMFSIVDPLSLDTLPDAHVLSGRPLNHEHSTDLGSVLLGAIDTENLSSIVEQTDSFFSHG